MTDTEQLFIIKLLTKKIPVSSSFQLKPNCIHLCVQQKKCCFNWKLKDYWWKFSIEAEMQVLGSWEILWGTKKKKVLKDFFFLQRNKDGRGKKTGQKMWQLLFHYIHTNQWECFLHIWVLRTTGHIRLTENKS